jgi:hypothetical protein
MKSSMTQSDTQRDAPSYRGMHAKIPPACRQAGVALKKKF